MNVKRVLRLRGAQFGGNAMWSTMWVTIAVGMWIFPVAEVHARDWFEMATNPFADPLLTRPPELELGKVLPGDSVTVPCSNGVSASADMVTLQALSLADAINISLCRNAQMQRAWAVIKVQAAAVGEAKAAYFPTITLDASRLNDRITSSESGFMRSELRSSTSSTNFTWRLFDFGGRDANRRSANALLRAALATRDTTLQRTLGNVVSAYFEAQTAQATWLAKQQNERIALQTLITTERRESQGAGAQSDTLQASTALAKTALERSRAQGAYRKSHAVLVNTLGLPAQIRLILEESLNDSEHGIQRQELTPWLEQALAQHPALVAAKAQLESSKQRVTAVRSEGLPTLDFTSHLYRNGRPNQGLSATQSEERVTGFTLSFPLFDGFSQTYKVLGAQAQIEQKEAELQDTQNQVLMEVVKAHADVAAAFDALGTSLNLMEAAQRTMESVQRKYDRGAADILAMLTVQAALSDAQQERIRSLAEWRSARLRLLANTGVLGRWAIPP